MRYDIPKSRTAAARNTVVLATASALLLTVGCTAVEAPNTPEESRTLTIAIAGDVETLDRDFSSFPTSNEVNFNTGDMFFQYGYKDVGEDIWVYDPENIEGRAIESWTLADDAKSIVLNIRKDQTFNASGNPVTADDFLYFFERNFADEHLSNMRLSNISSPDSVTKIDDHTIRIDFDAPAPLFCFLFRDQAQAVYDSKAIAENATADDPYAKEWAARNDTGSGPYSVESWEPGVEMVLAANEDYWAGAPFFEKVVLKVVPS